MVIWKCEGLIFAQVDNVTHFSQLMDFANGSSTLELQNTDTTLYDFGGVTTDGTITAKSTNDDMTTSGSTRHDVTTSYFPTGKSTNYDAVTSDPTNQAVKTDGLTSGGTQ